MTYNPNTITGGIDPRVQFLQGANCSSIAEIGFHIYVFFNSTFSISGLTPNSIIYMRLIDDGGNENGTVDFILTGTMLPVS